MTRQLYAFPRFTRAQLRYPLTLTLDSFHEQQMWRGVIHEYRWARQEGMSLGTARKVAIGHAVAMGYDVQQVLR